jgi:hypothetical protein
VLGCIAKSGIVKKELERDGEIVGFLQDVTLLELAVIDIGRVVVLRCIRG